MKIMPRMEAWLLRAGCSGLTLERPVKLASARTPAGYFAFWEQLEAALPLYGHTLRKPDEGEDPFLVLRFIAADGSLIQLAWDGHEVMHMAAITWDRMMRGQPLMWPPEANRGGH